MPGVIAGAAPGNLVSCSALIAAFAVIMLLPAVATSRRAGSGRVADRDDQPLCAPLRVGHKVFAEHIARAFFCVGGGFLIVSTLAIGVVLSMRLVVGTSLAIITATSVLALLAHRPAGRGIGVAVAGYLLISAAFLGGPPGA